MSDTISVFANGSQFMDWQEANCCRCKKYSYAKDPATGETRSPLDKEQCCQIELALVESAYGDGIFSPAIAARMGYTTAREEAEPLFPYCWACGEVEWTEEWKARIRARETEVLHA